MVVGSRLSLSAASLRDKALELAKRLNHSSVVSCHVLSISLTELNENDRQNLAEKIQVQLSNQPKGSKQATVSFTESAQDAVRKLVASDFSLEVFREILNEAQAKQVDSVVTDQESNSAAATIESVTQVEADPEVSTVKSERALEEVLAELDSLVGLAGVKKQVRSVMATHRVNQKRVSLGLKEIPNSLHLVFSGEPGTGKTTVARLVSEIYRAQGVLRVGHLVEVGRSDLIAEYVGQTAPKVKKAIKQALGGVLFIDEAYSLAQDTHYGYGAEAIATLLQLMENHRGDLSVIVAGYKDEMDFFVASNPGLRSRFQTYIDFPRYEPSELLQIFKRMCASNEIALPADAEAKVLKHFESNETAGVAGNARYARKLFEVAFTELSGRAVADGVIEDHEVSKFEASDIPDVLVQATKAKNKVGF